MRNKKVRLFRYDIPNEPREKGCNWGEGWGTAVLSNDGYFSAVTDYGNFAFSWHYGISVDASFRHIFLDFNRDYLLCKLAGETTFNLEKGLAAIKECYEPDQIPEGIEDCDGEWDFMSNYASELVEGKDVGLFYDYSIQEYTFVDRFIPRLKKAIRADLETKNLWNVLKNHATH